MPLLGDPAHAAVTSSLRTRIPHILRLRTPDRPRAIVLVTAHWTTPRPTISSGSSPSLLYDYYGFPPEAYQLKYPAPGDPGLAAQVAAAMKAQGLSPVLDDTRPWDHGVYVPLKIAIPEADMPIVQVSVLESEDPAEHYKMGRALATLREQNVAIIGSGFASIHNLGVMGALRGNGGGALSQAFLEFKGKMDEWHAALTSAVGEEDGEKRGEAIGRWRDMPHADVMHPPRGGEHFMPLIVCAGAAGEADGRAKMYVDEFLDLDIYTYYWGAPEVTV